MIEKPYCAIMSNHISENFPEFYQFILDTHSLEATYKKGEIISPVPREQIAYMVKGSIKSYMCDENGDERLIYILLSDTIFFSSVNDYFMKTLLVQEPTEIFFLDRHIVHRFLQTDCAYIDKYYQLSSYRYGILLQQALSVNHCSAKHKVYSFIYQIARKYGIHNSERNSVIIKNFPTFTDIASITGVHRSNATTYINELKSQNVIRKDKSSLVIKDLHLLELIIDDLNSCKN